MWAEGGLRTVEINNSCSSNPMGPMLEGRRAHLSADQCVAQWPPPPTSGRRTQAAWLSCVNSLLHALPLTPCPYADLGAPAAFSSPANHHHHYMAFSLPD